MGCVAPVEEEEECQHGIQFKKQTQQHAETHLKNFVSNVSKHIL